MTEKFSTAMYMDRGAEQLVELLNHYISAIVESECPRPRPQTLSVLDGGLCTAPHSSLSPWDVDRPVFSEASRP